ncbi:MAG TPA: hypothetical protein VEY89_01950, partial [Candidatus Dormibacteraeota bacterium]|nr:hypothetical protein [Candidatus Dormibacteraeota bacterium]
LFVILAVYTTVCALWMLVGVGGPVATHYVGLLSDAPAAGVERRQRRVFQGPRTAPRGECRPSPHFP